jgi:hypothetical protein
MSFPFACRSNLMTCISYPALFFAATWTFAVVAADPPAASQKSVMVDEKAREDVRKMPLEMARVLEAKQYKLCIETFIDPDAVKKAAAAGNIDALAEGFAEAAPGMIKLLKATKGVEPKMHGVDKAEFELKELADPKDGTPVVLLKKVGKYWYFSD